MPDQHGLALMTFSSAGLFDGRLGRPYVESDTVRAIDVASLSASMAERAVLAVYPGALVIRAGARFGPWDDNEVTPGGPGFRGEPGPSPRDVVSPTDLPDLAHAALDLLIDGERGRRHLANTGSASWATFAARVSAREGVSAAEAVWADAPGDIRNRALASERAWIMPALDDAIDRYLRDRAAEQRAASSRVAAA